jgi:hypothetical protein
VRPAVPDEDDGGLHFSFVHVAGERRGGKKVSNHLVAVREGSPRPKARRREFQTSHRRNLGIA